MDASEHFGHEGASRLRHVDVNKRVCDDHFTYLSTIVKCAQRFAYNPKAKQNKLIRLTLAIAFPQMKYSQRKYY